MSEENGTPSKRQKVESTSDLNSEIDAETLSEKKTDDNNLGEEQKTDENEIQENGENNFLEESNTEGIIDVELIVENNLIEEQIPVVEQPAPEERIHISQNKRKKLDKNMDIVTMIKTIQTAFIQNTHSFKRRIIRKMKKRIDILEGTIEQNINVPLLVDTTKHVETLQVELPIKDLQEFIFFDNIVSKNPEKIESLKTLMTVATRRSADIKQAIPNILKTLIGKEVQEGFSASGRGKNNLPFKSTLTYKTMRDVLLDYFHNTSDCDITTELSTWLARARDREGGRKNRA